jgi:sterol desaturase/sphingolipid hydroxylase (fatty acid hydroxylase superfamily)
MNAFTQPFTATHQWLFEHLVQPVLFALELSGHAETMFDFTAWFLLGCLEVAALWTVMRWVERRWPVEAVTDRATVRTDVFYTLLHRLGAFSLFSFALLQPLVDDMESWLRTLGYSRLNMDDLLPGVTDIALLSFVLYLLVFDLLDYWIHRAQHQWKWWWQLHSLHHAQRQMTYWSDNRNHLLDDLLRDAIFAAVAVFLGVPPAQFFALILASRVLQSLSHANWRTNYGVLGMIIVSPSFHRLHHAIGYGHEGQQRGCNFGVLFPWWDQLFRTVDWRLGYVPTGIRDQLDGRDYGRGFFAQQWLALLRLANVR